MRPGSMLIVLGVSFLSPSFAVAQAPSSPSAGDVPSSEPPEPEAASAEPPPPVPTESPPEERPRDESPPQARPRDEPSSRPPTHLGLGYKIGNGIGFVGGDVIIGPIPHLALDLQINYASYSTSSGKATGFGLAPELQAYLFEPGVHTPYLSAGFVYATMSLQNVTASATGFFVNAGYEWKWHSGLALLLGGGVGYLADVHATDGTTTLERSGGINPNLEASLRFMFL